MPAVAVRGQLHGRGPNLDGGVCQGSIGEAVSISAAVSGFVQPSLPSYNGVTGGCDGEYGDDNR